MKAGSLAVCLMLVAGCVPHSGMESTYALNPGLGPEGLPSTSRVGSTSRVIEATITPHVICLWPSAEFALFSYAYSGGPRPKNFKALRLWDITTDKEVWSSDESYNLAFFPDHKHALACKQGEWLRIVTFPEFQVVYELEDRRRLEGRVNVEVSADGKLGLTSEERGALALWDLDQGKRLQEWQVTNEPIHSITPCSSPGSNLAFCRIRPLEAPPWVLVWNLTTGKVASSWGDTKPWMMPLAWSPNGFYAVSDRPSEDDNRKYRLVLWEAGTSRVFREFEERVNADGKSLSTGNTRAAAFSADGEYLLTVDSDNMLRRWEVVTGKPVLRKKLDEELSLQTAAVSHHGKVIVTVAGYDTGSGGAERLRTKVWDADGHLLRILKNAQQNFGR